MLGQSGLVPGRSCRDLLVCELASVELPQPTVYPRQQCFSLVLRHGDSRHVHLVRDDDLVVRMAMRRAVFRFVHPRQPVRARLGITRTNPRSDIAEGFIHTVCKDGQWINEVEDGNAIGGVHQTKEEAVESGRARARQDNTEHVIHNQDGTIGERNSYGNDPASRPG